MKYLDTNVIIYAIENDSKYGKECKKILLDVERGKLKVCASMLILVEFINVLTKINKILKNERKEELNIKKNVEALLSIPIIWFDLDFLIIKKASEYDYNISGVDYIHLATIEVNGIKEIITADEEFNKVSFIKRIDPLEYN